MFRLENSSVRWRHDGDLFRLEIWSSCPERSPAGQAESPKIVLSNDLSLTLSNDMLNCKNNITQNYLIDLVLC